MKYLSIDIEATGLEDQDLIIEFAAIPIDGQKKILNENQTFHRYLYCPSFEELAPNLNPWVAKNNQTLIERAHSEGLSLKSFKDDFQKYLEQQEIKDFFDQKPIVLFGKSLSAIDLPFLKRDLGGDFMRKYFSHRTLDVTCLTYAYIDSGKLPSKTESGTELMKHFNMGEVAHTALEDAINTAKLYFKLLEL